MLEYYLISGDETTIVLLHDGIGCASLWNEFPQQVADKTGHSVFVYSRAGHGKSSPLTEEFSYQKEADVLYELLLQNNITNPILFGHSCGGVIGMFYAANYPVKKLVMTSPYFKYDNTMIKSLNRLMVRFEAGGMPHLSLAHRNVDDMFYPWVNKFSKNNFESEHISDVAKKITCHVEVLRYTDDPYSSDEQLALLKSSIPHATLTLLKGSSHTIHKRSPEDVIKLL